jgi:hypothetical protein
MEMAEKIQKSEWNKNAGEAENIKNEVYASNFTPGSSSRGSQPSQKQVR